MAAPFRTGCISLHNPCSRNVHHAGIHPIQVQDPSLFDPFPVAFQHNYRTFVLHDDMGKQAFPVHRTRCASALSLSACTVYLHNDQEENRIHSWLHRSWILRPLPIFKQVHVLLSSGNHRIFGTFRQVWYDYKVV